MGARGRWDGCGEPWHSAECGRCVKGVGKGGGWGGWSEVQGGRGGPRLSLQSG